MMPRPGDLPMIVAVTAGLGLLIALAGIWLMWRLRARSIGVMLAVVVVVAVTATLAGVVAIITKMFIEGPAKDFVLSVVAVGGLVGLGVAFVLARRVVGESRRLVQAVRAAPFVAPRGLPAELQTIANTLEEAYARERALEGARRELVAWVSHDLRTPLAGMRAMAEALEDGVVSDPATVARYHRQIKLEVERLSAMVDDLFELSRIHAGALRLSRARIGLADLLADTMAGAEPLARAKGVVLTAEASAAVPVEADAGALGRALGNLVVNAIRHTPSDRTVVLRAEVDAAGMACLSVTDCCGGIPEEDLPRVFEVAFRGEAARTPTADGGAGLGLAIAQGIVEAHDGVIDVVNDGPGCRFEIRLPLVGG
ncbi:two-component system sensor kinase [[Actinomadura] parvosata subsp. kistnae]|uniref:Sensor-like histidine kinase SenX3 n=1 Tax=[Actinomadura] parvosata subsp. kistnae TaxID=1909395 RepID=A0A1V0ABT5_9ACTN|nr:ATP-binding protein [Nonomuraea sp. ATCC 55076]AQZ67678.1 two-component sensor histidine kinase [Nonomuraea sp. ATCC 55076]SPL94036.1 two-component system sensor kinase [Actinomadura parvosata subsp. kistnae]